MGKKKRQTFGKHARERAIEEKRRLKRERKQAAAAERQAGPDAEQTDTIVPSADGEEQEHAALGIEEQPVSSSIADLDR
jgi:hypothetical protein